VGLGPSMRKRFPIEQAPVLRLTFVKMTFAIPGITHKNNWTGVNDSIL